MPERREGGVTWDIRRFDELDSTNSHLLAEARRGAPEGTVVVAAFQRAGRGRLDRAWVAPRGSALLASILLRPALKAEELPVAVAVAGLAASDACHLVAGIRPDLKWPNDLVVADPSSGATLKVGGILAESDWAPSPPAVVVGVGINVRWPENGDSIAELQAATSLDRSSGGSPGVDALLDALLDAFAARYATIVDPSGRREQMSEYRRRCTTIGMRVAVTVAEGAVEGDALDIDDAGRLLVDVGACTRTIAAGDVVHLRPVGG